MVRHKQNNIIEKRKDMLLDLWPEKSGEICLGNATSISHSFAWQYRDIATFAMAHSKLKFEFKIGKS
jgi:hypothetical protein